MGSVGLLLSLVFSTRAGLPLLLEVDLHLALLCPPLLLLLELVFVITVYGVDNWARQASQADSTVWISSSSFISTVFETFFLAILPSIFLIIPFEFFHTFFVLFRPGT